jgi:3-phenylpropionate/trans-cinnamate dioxygenase ferredoxin reductase component
MGSQASTRVSWTSSPNDGARAGARSGCEEVATARQTGVGWRAIVAVPVMSNRESVVVIGAGQAAAQLAISLRQGGLTAPVIVIGEEVYLPYQRPPLSKKFLSEPRAPDTLLLRPEAFWRDRGVVFHLGTPVGVVDPARHCLTLTDGREFTYGWLVFATGTSARVLRVPGITLPGVFSVRTIDDVLRLRPALDAARRVVIIGAGYIGLEVAAAAGGEGRQVTVLEAEDRVLKRVTGANVSAFFDRIHRARGVHIRLGARLEAIEGENAVTAVRTQAHERWPADVVLIAVGSRANDDLAAAAGLACHDGIVVDETARTAHPNIYAVGDCTRFPSRRYARTLRLECVQNAIDQAKAAAASILQAPTLYDPVPWFWSDQYDLKLQIAGLHDGHEHAAVIGDLQSARFSVEYQCGGRLIAVDAINDARAHMMARKRIAEQTAELARTSGAAAESSTRRDVSLSP